MSIAPLAAPDLRAGPRQRRSQRFAGVSFGRGVVIGRNVSIGAGTVIGHHVVVHDDTVIGRDVRIDDGCVLGKQPLRSRMSAVTRVRALAGTVVGDECLLGTHVVVYRGCVLARGVLVADQATVREDVTVGELTIIGRGVAVENQVSIGARCKIETGAYITAMSTIAERCFIAPEVTFTNDNFVGRTEERFKHFGGVTLERGARVGANATVLPGKTVGADALVAAGSMVTRDVPPCTVVLGSPARAVRPVPVEQLLSAVPSAT